MKRRWFFYCLIFVLVAWLHPAKTGFGAVTLKYFDVSWDDTAQQVKLRWETATELDNLGFQVKRKVTGSAGGFTVVKLCPKSTGCTESEKEEFIFAEGGTMGRLYGDYFDSEIQPLVSYTYQLIAIDTSQREEIAETKTIITSNQPPSTGSPIPSPTQSPSATSSPTSTFPTATPRQNNPNPRRTPTPIPPSPTTRIVLPTDTPLPSSTMEVNVTVNEPEPSATLEALGIPTLPMPSITLIYPDTPTPELEVIAETPEAGSLPQNATWFTPSRLLVIGLVVLVWTILGGWFVFALRKIQ